MAVIDNIYSSKLYIILMLGIHVPAVVSHIIPTLILNLVMIRVKTLALVNGQC